MEYVIRMRRIRADNRGVEGLPLNLMVSLLVLAIALPQAFLWFDAYSLERADSGTREEVGAILSAARQCYFQGVGNSRSVDVDLRGAYGHELRRVTIGDALPNGERRCLASYKIGGQGEQLLVMEPSVPLTSPGNAALSFGAGSHTVIAECKEAAAAGGGRLVYVELRLA